MDIKGIGVPDANGCSLLVSAAPTMVNIRARLHTVGLTNIIIRDVIGVPWVIVPVLSNTIVFTWNKGRELER